MNLNKLPQYLESIRSGGKVDEGVVVDIGQIVSPSSFNWRRNSAFAITACLLLVIGSAVTYTNLVENKITVIMSTNNLSAENVLQLVSLTGGQVVNVKQKEDYTYELRIERLKNVKSFLESLRKNKDINNVEKIGL